MEDIVANKEMKETLELVRQCCEDALELLVKFKQAYR